VLPVLAVALLGIGLIGPAATAGPVATKSGSEAAITPAQRLASGPLPKNAAAYARAKAQAKLASSAAQRAPAAVSTLR